MIPPQISALNHWTCSACGSPAGSEDAEGRTAKSGPLPLAWNGQRQTSATCNTAVPLWASSSDASPVQVPPAQADSDTATQGSPRWMETIRSTFADMLRMISAC